MALFDPNVRFERPPKRRTPIRRVIFSWAVTALIIALVAASVFIGLPLWVATVLVLAVLAGSTILTRRWR